MQGGSLEPAPEKPSELPIALGGLNGMNVILPI